MTQATEHQTIDDFLGTLAPPKASAGLREAVYRAGVVAADTGGARKAPAAPWHTRLLSMMMRPLLRPVPVMAALMLAVAVGWTLPGPEAGPGIGSGTGNIVATATGGEEETLLAEEMEEFLLGDLDAEGGLLDGQETSAETGGNSVTMSAYASDSLALE